MSLRLSLVLRMKQLSGGGFSRNAQPPGAFIGEPLVTGFVEFYVSTSFQGGEGDSVFVLN